jgi:LAS superfamily LD-carboxypeptidase LdcB
MRIIEPKAHSPSTKANHKKMSKKYFFILSVILISVSIVLYIFSRPKPVETPAVQSDTETKEELRTFSGNEFRLLYDNYLLPNTSKIDTPPIITGNDIADGRIRQIAEKRGYKIRVTASTILSNTDGHGLQKQAHQPWKDMQTEAKQAGLIMTIVSAYRSVDEQRQLFIDRIQFEGISISQVATGMTDAEIDKVLVTTSIPGYSKHHSGYTIDLLCQGWSFENFKNSPCNEWLIQNNYENAKKFGFIPSYPEGADLQGPEPEAWEYVYVGKDVLYY